MWSFLRGEPDTVIRWARWLIVAGLALGPLSAQLHLPFAIAAVFMVYLGACAGSLVQWREEHGLWMLAALFLVCSVAVYGLFAFGEIRDLVRGAPSPDVGLMIDFSLGTALLSVSIRFLWQVARFNRQLPAQSAGTTSSSA